MGATDWSASLSQLFGTVGLFSARFSQHKDRFELEIVDVYQQPQMIQGEQVFATPTLIKYQPAPLRRIIGDMTDANRLCVGLGLPCEEPA